MTTGAYQPYGLLKGKTAVINQLVPQARGAIIGFSDANTFWEPPALRRLARRVGLDDLSAMCGVVAQAHALGAPIAQRSDRCRSGAMTVRASDAAFGHSGSSSTVAPIARPASSTLTSG